MKIVLSNQKKVAQFACILRHLKNLSSDIEWSISAEQFYTQGMDSSHACLFEIQLNPEWFDVYEVEKNCMLGINCELIFKIFNCLGENQKVDIEYDDTKDNLCISLLPIEGEKGIEKIFELPLINMEVDMLDVPDTEWSADIEMLSSEFSQLIDQLSIFGNDLAIKCNDEITLTGSGEHGKMNARIKNDDILKDNKDLEKFLENITVIEKDLYTIFEKNNIKKIDTKDKKPMLLKEIDFRRHSFIVGASGFGKTNLISILQENSLRHDKPIIFFDPKGDTEALNTFKGICEK